MDALSKEAKFQIGIKALITNAKGEILLLKAGEEELRYVKKPFWDLPGGRIQPGATIEETLKREVNEELGIEKKDIRVLNIFDATVSNFKIIRYTPPLSLMLIVYRCKLNSNKKFRLSKEHSAYEWISISRAKMLLKEKFPKEFITKLSKLDNLAQYRKTSCGLLSQA